MGSLDRIVRYPVKGLAGQPTDTAVLRADHGLAYDRAFAIETGAAPTVSGWAPRETFFHLARDSALIEFRAHVDEPASRLRIEPPGSTSIDVRLDDAHRNDDMAAAGRALADVLPVGRAAPRLVMPSDRVWDWPDASLSLINLDTLEELSQRAGRRLDPRRFRANLYVSGLGAWEEFDLIGQRVRLGEATVEVMWPTDRCRATTIDPETGDTDLNLPALLASQVGHMFCGVYLRVVEGGQIETGAKAEPVEAPRSAPYRAGDDALHWPRRATVTSIVHEGGDVVSFWLRDPLAFARRTRPGQHLRIHPTGDVSSALWRCYTISGIDGDAYRVSVKRDGVVSSLLHDAYKEGTGLVVTGPFGDVTLDAAQSRPAVFISAGIGLTPTLAMLRGLDDDGRDVRVVHVDRGEPPAGLWGEVESELERLSHASVVRYDTMDGRPHPATIADVVRGLVDPTVYVCGPAGFYEDVHDALVAAEVDPESIRHEVFFSPSTAQRTEPKPPPEPGPFTVQFGSGDDSRGVWDVERGSLLDVGESLGLPMPSGCRAGVCGTCALRVTSGTTSYVNDPVISVPRGATLLCSAVPTSDVTVELPQD